MTHEVKHNPRGWYEVGEWAFDPTDGDDDLQYINDTIAVWTTWRNFVTEGKHLEQH